MIPTAPTQPDDSSPPEPTGPARVAIVMGSRSDWPVMGCAAEILDELDIAHVAEVVSAHRTPLKMVQFAQQAESRGLQVIIAGAGGAAHLPGMLAALTTLPVLGVPVAHAESMLRGIDALLSIVQMPRGVPVPTLAIGKAGAANAALSAASILALHDPELASRLRQFRQAQADRIAAETLP